MNKKLKPCPFCGNTKVELRYKETNEIEIVHRLWSYENYIKCYAFVYCNECDMIGPQVKYLKENAESLAKERNESRKDIARLSAIKRWEERKQINT